MQRLGFACELAGKVDILFIVEAHGQDGCQTTLVERLRKSHRVEYFPGPSQAVGGVILCIKHQILTRDWQATFKVLDKGRVVSVMLSTKTERLGAIGVHIDPHYSLTQKKDLLQRVTREIQTSSDATWVVCGDFNFEALGERTYNADRGAFIESLMSEQLGLYWSEAAGNLVEHHQPEFTRAQTGPSGATLSRIDRIYSNLPAWRLLSTEIRTMTVGRVTDAGRLSDHVPVLSFAYNVKDNNSRPLPLWATKDAFYKHALDHQISQYNLEAMRPVDAVLQLKRCMRYACRQVAQKGLRRGARTIEEQIYWSLVCVRALFHGCAGRAAQALIAYPTLEEYVLVSFNSEAKLSVNMDGLNGHIASLMRESLGRLLSDVDEVRGLAEYQRLEKRCAISRLMDSWATRGRKASLQGARDQTGAVISDPDQAADAFVAHWKEVAEEKRVDKQAARQFLSQYMRRIPSFRVILTFEEFLTIVRGLPDSACGPDGIPYSGWKHASDGAVYVLYRLYCSLFTDEEIAEDFNYSWLILLAKGGHRDDDAVLARAPGDTRPVSLANSDSKICEIALDKPLARAMAPWASWDQRGFLEARMMVDNVIEIDTHGRIAALTANQGKNHSMDVPGMEQSKFAVMAFFDFAAAFPSVAWVYLWMCMKYCGLPKAYIKAFQKVYKNNVHFLRFMGKVYRAYVNASGVKTGGTASGTIFVLCIDPFLQLLRSRVGPRDFGKGFADDIGYIILDISVTLPALAECFQLFGRVSNVMLKINKTVIVPLWTCNIAEATEVIMKIVPTWKGVRVKLSAKYLGMQLGPRSADSVWTSALNKYVARVQASRGTGAGLLSSILEYNIMCVSTLSYIGQFCVASAEVLSTEARMLQRLTGCPRNTFTKESLWSLGHFGMTHSFNSIQVCSTAAMIRMALQTSTSFTNMKLLYDKALDDDDCMMLSLVSGEASGFDTPAIVNTLQKAIDHAFLPDIHHTAWKLFLRSATTTALDLDLQRMISKYLSKLSLNFNATEFLTKRMARWRNGVSDLGKTWWDFSGPFVAQLCQNELSGVPQCVIAAYIKTLLNGWASTRRLKMHPRKCVFDCGSHQDCIEHYMECRNVEAIWNHVVCRDWGPLESRFAVGCATMCGRITRTFFIYGIYSAYNSRRHGHAQGNAVDVCTSIVKSRMGYALGRSSPHIRRLISRSAGAEVAAPRDEGNQYVGGAIFNFRKRSRALAQLASTKRGRDKGAKKARTSSCTASKLHV